MSLLGVPSDPLSGALSDPLFGAPSEPPTDVRDVRDVMDVRLRDVRDVRDVGDVDDVMNVRPADVEGVRDVTWRLGGGYKHIGDILGTYGTYYLDTALTVCELVDLLGQHLLSALT